MAADRPLHVGRPNIGNRALFHQYLDEVFDAAWLSNDGQMVQRLEEQIQRYTRVRHAIAVTNGTLGLEVAAQAAELTGEVIVPAFTFVATAHALRWLGLTPVFADIDPATHNIDPRSVESLITERTSAIVGVHLWGRPADVTALSQIADRHGLRLMFDAAHAFGCSRDGLPIGSNGDAEILSFHATKFFNTFEGGAILTNDDELARRARLIRNFGFDGLDSVVTLGTNAKMSEASGAMGLVNFGIIDEVIEHNRSNYLRYLTHAKRLPGISMLEYDPAEQNNFQYIVMEVGPRAPVSRDQVLAALRSHDVLARRYFWPGVHRMAPYRDEARYAHLELPGTHAVADQVLVLPTGPEVGEADIDRIMFEVERALAGGSG